MFHLYYQIKPRKKKELNEPLKSQIRHHGTSHGHQKNLSVANLFESSEIFLMSNVT